jgi:hypothetical protein
MWRHYFKFVKLQPGRVVTALFGLIDFSDDNIPVEKIKALYESDFPYLQITEAGMEELYGIPPKAEEATETAVMTNPIIVTGRSRKQKRFS